MPRSSSVEMSCEYSLLQHSAVTGHETFLRQGRHVVFYPEDKGQFPHLPTAQHPTCVCLLTPSEPRTLNTIALALPGPPAGGGGGGRPKNEAWWFGWGGIRPDKLTNAVDDGVRGWECLKGPLQGWNNTVTSWQVILIVSDLWPGWVQENLHWADRPFHGHQVKGTTVTHQLEHPNKSAVAEHSVDPGHHLLFHSTSILITKTRYMDCIVKEAIETEHRPYSMNGEVGFCFSKLWQPLICSHRNLLNMMLDPLATQVVHNQEHLLWGSFVMPAL
jgi:hypothetical protein